MRKHIACLSAVLMLGAIVPVASAYVVPSHKPGTAGGPCVPATGGNKQSRTITIKLCNRAAAFTGAELAVKGTVSLTIHFKKPTIVKCNVQGQPVNQPNVTQQLGKATLKWKKKRHGAKNIKLIYGQGGVAFLNAYNTVGEKLLFSCSTRNLKKHHRKFKGQGKVHKSSTFMVTMH